MAKKDQVQEEGEVESTGVRIRPNLETYVNGVSGSGKKTKRANNPVSEALDGFTVEETAAVAQAMCDIPAKELLAKYADRNIGMQKMNLANRIRGAVAKLDKAHLADKSVASGLRTLAINCEKGQAAVASRNSALAATKADREAKAAAKAAEAADKPAKAPKAAKPSKKAA